MKATERLDQARIFRDRREAGQPELGIGAVAPGGVRVLNEEILPWPAVSEAYLETAAREEAAEVERRMRLFRNGEPAPEVEGITAILVDDGIATGVTARAAIEYLRRRDRREAAPRGGRTRLSQRTRPALGHRPLVRGLRAGL